MPDTEKGYTDKKYHKVEKYLFFIGFIFPVAWFVGSAYCCGDRQATFVWRKRCTIASTLVLTVFTISVVVVMTVRPDIFGLRSNFNSDSQKAPTANSSDWSDTAAGVSINE